MLVVTSAIQGMGTGVAGVKWRVPCRVTCTLALHYVMLIAC